MNIIIHIANEQHAPFAEAVCCLIEKSAEERKTGIARRKASYILEKMKSGKAVIAFVDGELAGFCYIETWTHQKYVANSGLIVAPKFRKMGLAKAIKKKAFDLARNKFPNAKVFGITTSLAVMKINTELGYQAVTFSELTQDEAFWDGCKSCPNFDILQRNEKQMCLCTGMLAPSKNETDMKFNLTNQIIKK